MDCTFFGAQLFRSKNQMYYSLFNYRQFLVQFGFQLPTHLKRLHSLLWKLIIICLHMDQQRQENTKTGIHVATTSLEEMRRTILVEIPDVTEDDLNVMSNQEIKLFYSELILGCTQGDQQHPLNGSTKPVSQAQEPQDKLHIEKEMGNERKNAKQVSEATKVKPHSLHTKAAPETVVIKGVQYYKPKYLTQQAYQLAFNRYQILYGPQLTTIDHKKSALLTAYPSTYQNRVRALTPREVNQTYERLRAPEKKQHHFLKLSRQPDIKEFCLYVPTHPRDQLFEQFERKLTKQKALKQTQRSRQRQTQRSRQRQRQKQVQKQREIDIDIDINMIEKSVQTEKSYLHPQDNENIVRKDITIVSRVQYVEQQEEPAQLWFRPRSQKLKVLQQMNLKHKINGADMKKLLVQPHQTPREHILAWAQSIKKLVDQFEEQYLKQFKNDWGVTKN